MQQTTPRTIGVLAPLLGGFYYGALVAGIHREAQRRDASVLVIQTSGEDFGQPTATPFDVPLAQDHVDAWIVILTGAEPEFLRQLQRDGKPVIALSIVLEGFPSVVPDNRSGMAAAVAHLIQHGHTRIGFAGNLGQHDLRERYAGYQTALREAGIEPDPALFFTTTDNLTVGGEVAAQQLIEAGLPCSAVVAATDLNALGMLNMLRAGGTHVPVELALVGFDDIDVVQYTIPPISSVRQRVDVLGETAAALALRTLDGETIPPDIYQVPTMLIPRGSCGCRSLTTILRSPTEGALSGSFSREAFITRLVELALAPVRPEPGVSAVEIWPGAPTIIDALDAVIYGRTPPSIEEQTIAWQQALALNTDLDALSAMILLLEQTGEELVLSAPDPGAAHERLKVFLGHIRTDVIRAKQVTTQRSIYTVQSENEINYHINMSLLGGDGGESARSLSWLSWTPAQWASLGLWAADDPAGEDLEIVGVFDRDGRLGKALPLVGRRSRPQSFPPAELLAAARTSPDAITIAIQVRTPAKEWGVLSFVSPLEIGFSYGLNPMGQWAAQLGAALEREALVTELNASRSRAEALQHEAEEANRMKSQFLANMSHELRTPLNAIINFTNFIGHERHGTLNERQQGLQQRIRANADHLLGLINDILDIAKIEAGKLDLFFEEVEPRPIFDGVMSTAMGLIKDKGLWLNLDLPEDLPTVWIDRTRLRQVLLNLLSNAAKFTQEGGITMRAELQQDGYVCVSVQDTGIGIAPEHHGIVFQEFRQVEDEFTRQHQGTGLGLPISKRLIEMHGGQMWLESSLGNGSTFSFTIPVAQRPPSVAEDKLEAASGPLVVVVDDDPNSQHILREHLEQHNYQVHAVLDSRKALEAIRQLQPHLVILDVFMPHMDGWSVLNELRKDDLLRSTPVIMCSIADQAHMSVAFGANAHIVKPLREEEVIGTIERWVGLPATIMVVDDHADARQIIRGILEPVGCRIIEATNGAEALARLPEDPPDIVILDLVMPEMDGFDMLSRLRADPAWQRLPVVVITSKDLSADEQKWLQERSHVCLQKSTLAAPDFLSYMRQFIQRPSIGRISS